ncbi:unnamed protein product [Symbiodinium necroappetens]|uniref:Uncharacterized protein n=1 Tax=Symbiodinium necroappetens TaxID=1628268 RepID=A0A812XL82_9DINO|nr:unnamed protein product [Symbiodinium necroappetens]
MPLEISSFYVVSLAMALRQCLVRLHGDSIAVQQQLSQEGPWSRVFEAARGLFGVLRYQQEQSEEVGHELLAIVLFVLSTARHAPEEDDAVMVDVEASFRPVELPSIMRIPCAKSFREKLILAGGSFWREAAVDLRDSLGSAVAVLKKEESNLSRPALQKEFWMAVQDLDDLIENADEQPRAGPRPARGGRKVCEQNQIGVPKLLAAKQLWCQKMLASCQFCSFVKMADRRQNGVQKA